MQKKSVSIHTYKPSNFVKPGQSILPEDLVVISEEFAMMFYEQGFADVLVASWIQDNKVWVKIEA